MWRSLDSQKVKIIKALEDIWRFTGRRKFTQKEKVKYETESRVGEMKQGQLKYVLRWWKIQTETCWYDNFLNIESSSSSSYSKYGPATITWLLGSLAMDHAITLGLFLSLFISSVNDRLCLYKRAW